MYSPLTKQQREEMVKETGYRTIDNLFEQIPLPVRMNGIPDIPRKGMTEPELLNYFENLSRQNNTRGALFIGAGVYDHTIPSAVEALASRSEFVTAYTPYQPEISQGTLTAIFEYQTMICELTGLDVSNASLYDAATAACEAMLMACNHSGNKNFAVSKGVHPEVTATLRTYARFTGNTVIELEMDPESGETLPPEGSFGGVLIQSPNFYGIVEPMKTLAQEAKACGAIPVALCDPLSLGLLKSPGECGFDIAIGECQPLGLRLSFGGPYAGYMAVREPFMRKMPGRIVGETSDKDGRTAYVLTLQAREQHIRRDKATSNICSNQALCALTATIWLSLMGVGGLKEAAVQSAQKAAYTREALIKKGFEPLYNGYFFREFAMRGHIKGAYHLAGQRTSLIAVTEKRTKEEIDAFVEGADAK